ncbi:hypothetical protein CRV02_08295 [Arcobacter sp. CECT 8989]|uniref:helix-turn-helix domain-containing protein n=1 Tax=Arcobacter sp. CECT 8989 TaxID=2044509 RepID=UPI00100AD8C5|nr:helix-turn-helix domain-containing protein [Arcobacter sp. CECT 8989]RXK01499.1 hypothetical protein CRV02_08295 [Arcobacter sp. CECT 8989]
MLLFEDVIKRLKESLQLKTDKEMYEFMGTNQGKFSMWKSRNKIPYEEITNICCNKNLDLNYILNGKKQQNFVDYKKENKKMLEKLTDLEHENLYHLLKSNII